jgi:hypothetical protein
VVGGNRDYIGVEMIKALISAILEQLNAEKAINTFVGYKSSASSHAYAPQKPSGLAVECLSNLNSCPDQGASHMQHVRPMNVKSRPSVRRKGCQAKRMWFISAGNILHGQGDLANISAEETPQDFRNRTVERHAPRCSSLRFLEIEGVTISRLRPL